MVVLAEDDWQARRMHPFDDTVFWDDETKAWMYDFPDKNNDNAKNKAIVQTNQWLLDQWAPLNDVVVTTLSGWTPSARVTAELQIKGASAKAIVLWTEYND